MKHPFDEAVGLSARSADGHDMAHEMVHYSGSTSPAYANMVGPFGGVTGATLLTGRGERPVLACARALSLRNGYFDQSAEVWGDVGQPLASTHQMVYYRN